MKKKTDIGVILDALGFIFVLGAAYAVLWAI
jgi:hypothetical protein